MLFDLNTTEGGKLHEKYMVYYFRIYYFTCTNRCIVICTSQSEHKSYIHRFESYIHSWFNIYFYLDYILHQAFLQRQRIASFKHNNYWSVDMWCSFNYNASFILSQRNGSKKSFIAYIFTDVFCYSSF